MREVILKFKDLKTLINFTLEIDAQNIAIDDTDVILFGFLTEREIELAENGFNAVNSSS